MSKTRLSDLKIGPAGEDDSSAALEINSTTQGFKLPRMTTAQRDAIVVNAESEGLVIYNTTTNAIESYDGSSWS